MVTTSGHSTGIYEPEEWKDKTDPPGTHDYSKTPSAIRAWNTARNAGLDISCVPRQNSTCLWYWTCPEGHEWRETMNSVFCGKRRWKTMLGVGAASCRECAYLRYAPRYRCGHIKRELRELSKPPFTTPEPCPECEPEEHAARRKRIDARWRTPGRDPYRDPLQEMMTEAAQRMERVWALRITPEPPGIGRTHPPTGLSLQYTSVDQRRVETYARQHHDVETVGVEVPNLLTGEGTSVIHPDLVVNGTIAVEVDSPADRRGGTLTPQRMARGGPVP